MADVDVIGVPALGQATLTGQTRRQNALARLVKTIGLDGAAGALGDSHKIEQRRRRGRPHAGDGGQLLQRHPGQLVAAPTLGTWRRISRDKAGTGGDSFSTKNNLLGKQTKQLVFLFVRQRSFARSSVYPRLGWRFGARNHS
jgi:hypothetical protein